MAPVDHKKYHDTHVLIRKDLHKKALERAGECETNFTTILNKALEQYLSQKGQPWEKWPIS